jgi:hypothetical protein
VQTSHLGKALDNFVCAGPLEAGWEGVGFRMEVCTRVVEDEVRVRLVDKQVSAISPPNTSLTSERKPR